MRTISRNEILGSDRLPPDFDFNLLGSLIDRGSFGSVPDIYAKVMKHGLFDVGLTNHKEFSVISILQADPSLVVVTYPISILKD